MEGDIKRGRWNIKASVGRILLLMCMFIPTLTCPPGDYSPKDGVCCNKCAPGFKLVGNCHATGMRSNCTACPEGKEYMDQINSFPNCKRCRQCKSSKKEIEVSPCEKDKNTICQCLEGYYKVPVDSETTQCIRCTNCTLDNEFEKQGCTAERNTVCECEANYYRVKGVKGRGKCEVCKSCSPKCSHLCTHPITKQATEDVNVNFINVIVGAAVMALALIVLVIIVTYWATKRSTKKKLLKSSSQPSDSTESYNILMHEEGLNLSSVAASPQSPLNEQEPSNLPDCVPLEIKIPDLIYTVLGVVPVLQVKQLVRSLGVKDTEIEQAELDYRSCKEAHYQMLRVWAEMGSRAGGGGRGGMLHQPLLQELLDKLRNMHLGWAAQELETKYGIQ